MIVYSGPNCPRCKLLIKAMRKANLPFEERELDGAAKTDCVIETEQYILEFPVVRDGKRWTFASELFDERNNLRSDWREILYG